MRTQPNEVENFLADFYILVTIISNVASIKMIPSSTTYL